MPESIPYVACCDATIIRITRIVGMAGLRLVAGQTDLNLVLGVPMPDRRHSLTKEVKSAPCQSIARPIPPTTAIAGVALKMNLPADHAI